MGQGKRAWIYCAIDAPEDRFQILQENYDVDAYSPLEGKIEFGS